MQPRITGDGPATVWIDDVSLTLDGKVDVMPPEEMAKRPAVENAALKVELHPQDATFTVTDRRTARGWAQVPLPGGPMLTSYKPVDGGFDLQLVMPETARTFTVALRLAPDRPELTVELRGEGPMAVPLRFPAPFETRKGDFLIMPVNEGISYPVDDASLPEMGYILYGGHGLCMAWYGVTAGHAGHDGHRRDAGRRRRSASAGSAACWLRRRSGTRRRAPSATRAASATSSSTTAATWRWPSATAPTRSRSACFKTLAEKRVSVPAVDLLVGAVNVWCWDPDAPAICRRMQAPASTASSGATAASRRRSTPLNAMGVLTSRYDIYQDVMDPANFPKLRGVHPDWTDARPGRKDCIVGADGRLDRRLDGARQGRPAVSDCGVLCDLRALDYARRRMPAELADHPYRCRFIDTTTASALARVLQPRPPDDAHAEPHRPRWSCWTW